MNGKINPNIERIEFTPVPLGVEVSQFPVGSDRPSLIEIEMFANIVDVVRPYVGHWNIALHGNTGKFVASRAVNVVPALAPIEDDECHCNGIAPASCPVCASIARRMAEYAYPDSDGIPF